MRLSVFLAAFAVIAFSSHRVTAEEAPVLKAHPRQETAEMRDLMIGAWYGELKTKDGDFKRALTKRKEDGTFSVHFIVTQKNGRVVNFKEAGIWGVRKPIYFTATRGFIENGKFEKGNVESAMLYDAYEIIKLTRDELVYYSLTSGNTFSSKRVSNDFEMK